jgi:hypothetical protein
LGTVRFSKRAGDTVVYRFKGKDIALITSKGRSYSKAKIYIDGHFKKTVNAYSKKSKKRQTIYSKTFAGTGVHKIKIVNLATKRHKRFDIDGLAVGR